VKDSTTNNISSNDQYIAIECDREKYFFFDF
jgi:hypothetical protein